MKISKEQLKDIGIRTLKTFIAVACASLVVNVESLLGVSDIDGLKEFALKAVISAVTAGLTAVLNIAIKLFNNWFDDKNLTQEEINEALGDDFGE